MMYHVGRKQGFQDAIDELENMFNRRKTDRTLIDAIAKQFGLRRPKRK